MNEMSKEEPPSYEKETDPLNNEQQASAPPPPPQTFAGAPQQTVFSISQTPGSPNSWFGPGTTQMTCPYCHDDISTTVQVEPTMKTHLVALLLCVCGCWPCFWIPYVTDSCRGKKHYCPRCHATLGVFSEW